MYRTASQFVFTSRKSRGQLRPRIPPRHTHHQNIGDRVESEV